MAQGGNVTLVNASPYDWTLTSTHSYQMNSWSWPSTVSAGTANTVYIEWELDVSMSDDAGEAYYSIAETGEIFHVQARNTASKMISVVLDSLETDDLTSGSTMDLGWITDNSLNFILSGSDTIAYTSRSPAVDWMQQALPEIGSRKLRHICMPGSHDAGMSTLDGHTGFSTEENTVTQMLNIYDQLKVGSRFFDIRPVIADGAFKTGHYSDTGTSIGWQGGNGERISDIINNVNDFTDEYNELVILRLSHTLNTDSGYVSFTQDNWNDLFNELENINNRFMVPSGSDVTTIDLTNLPLSNFIGNGNPSVIIFAELDSGVTMGDFSTQGFYTVDNFPHTDDYADSNSVSTMASDQLSKLASDRQITSSTTNDQFFLLSWTLTQQIEDILNEVTSSIKDLAADAYGPLFSQAFNAITAESFPNVLYVDAMGYDYNPDSLVSDPTIPEGVIPDREITVLAMAINALAGTNSVIAAEASDSTDARALPPVTSSVAKTTPTTLATVVSTTKPTSTIKATTPTTTKAAPSPTKSSRPDYCTVLFFLPSCK